MKPILIDSSKPDILVYIASVVCGKCLVYSTCVVSTKSLYMHSDKMTNMVGKTTYALEIYKPCERMSKVVQMLFDKGHLLHNFKINSWKFYTFINGEVYSNTEVFRNGVNDLIKECLYEG